MSSTSAELASTQAVLPESRVGIVHVSFARPARRSGAAAEDRNRVVSVARLRPGGADHAADRSQGGDAVVLRRTIPAGRYRSQRGMFHCRDGLRKLVTSG